MAKKSRTFKIKNPKNVEKLKKSKHIKTLKISKNFVNKRMRNLQTTNQNGVSKMAVKLSVFLKIIRYYWKRYEIVSKTCTYYGVLIYHASITNNKITILLMLKRHILFWHKFISTKRFHFEKP